MNQNATAWSVVRHAIAGAMIGAVLYGALSYFGEWSMDHWPIKLTAIAGLFAFIYGLIEWQGGSDELLPPNEQN
ncbi:MAG: hypothetical protein WD845_13300 [Pirellulales bacterium]